MSIQDKYALTDEGVHNVRLGAFWTAASNLAIFGGVGIIYTLGSALVAHLTEGTALPDPAPYALAIIIFAIVLFVTEYLAYYYQ